ncbi:hypothetical protein FOQG_19067 [Fusarium oxysporum f. sp. raphani 54005]|uniref:Uncharacterized protein n=1 Tax=Fusarium oxysporum f. sp. raphani 54005 TaxID=1089458 RepID=X0BBK6_FUSOX|nr:hypothetical protein FOQG_19067 [Fusarium oxysporum f. sp. raphani 54005]
MIVHRSRPGPTPSHRVASVLDLLSSGSAVSGQLSLD